VSSRDPAVLKAASPIQHFSKDLPSTLLLVSENDFPMLERDARTVADKATGAGREVTMFVDQGWDPMGAVRACGKTAAPSSSTFWPSSRRWATKQSNGRAGWLAEPAAVLLESAAKVFPDSLRPAPRRPSLHIRAGCSWQHFPRALPSSGTAGAGA
jgi:hypothetical protein